MRPINVDWKRVATTLVAFVCGYAVASAVGVLMGTKHPFGVDWSGLAAGLAAFLLVSFALGTFSKSRGNG